MKKYFFICLLFVFMGCEKNKTVMICGDHICVNKTEARQFFEENLTIEVKIMDKKEKKEIDLVELNLKENSERRQINIVDRNTTKKRIRLLSDDEIKNIKKEVNQKKIKKNIAKKSKFDDKKIKLNKKSNKETVVNKKSIRVLDQKVKNEVTDVCLILEKCNIEEISKFLIQYGKNKKFPNITSRE